MTEVIFDPQRANARWSPVIQATVKNKPILTDKEHNNMCNFAEVQTILLNEKLTADENISLLPKMVGSMVKNELYKKNISFRTDLESVEVQEFDIPIMHRFPIDTFKQFDIYLSEIIQKEMESWSLLPFNNMEIGMLFYIGKSANHYNKFMLYKQVKFS